MTVVVGFVDTAEGAAALAAGAREAQRRHTELVVVPLADSLPPATIEAAPALAGQQVRITEPPAKDKTDHLLAVAEQERADVIVIGLRHRNPVGKLILGASAQRILLDAPCEVLTVKPRETGEEEQATHDVL